MSTRHRGRFTHLSCLATLILTACEARKFPSETLNVKRTQTGSGFSVLEHHNGPSRNGVYIHPSFTRSAAGKIDLEFSAAIEGVVNAQPLFLDGEGSAPDMVLVATEQNQVFAIEAPTGMLIWKRVLDPPLPRQVLIDVLGGCGSFDPIGITGTPVIDEVARAIYFDLVTPDAKRYSRHLIYALSVDDGSTLPGWPVDVGESVPGFRDIVQHQRGALTLLGGRVYVPYGGYTDCGDYRGWLVGISTSDPASVGAWSPDALGSGIWGLSGVASDGKSLFVATGNGIKATEWGGNEAIIRLGGGPTFSGQAADYFAPSDWPKLDQYDQDLGGSGVILFDVPDANSSQLAAALGKDTKMYLVDRSNLGGIDGAILAERLTNFVIITSPSAYTTAKGTYVVFSGYGYVIGCPGGENVSSIAVDPTSPLTISTAWCANAPGLGSTIVTTSDGTSDSIVWVVGAAVEGQLYGFNGDTGELIAVTDPTGAVQRYTAPIAAKGRIYIGATDRLYAFAVPSPPTDGGVDGGDGGGADGGSEGGADGGTDAGADGGSDRGVDGGSASTVPQTGCACGTGSAPSVVGAVVLVLLILRRTARANDRRSTRAVRHRSVPGFARRAGRGSPRFHRE